MDLSTRPTPRGLPSVGSTLVTRPFVVAVILLATAATLAGPVARWMRFKQGKRPLPLRASLNSLDEKALSPYRVVRRTVLEPVVVEALGTERYLSWTLEDTSVPAGDPLRFANLLVTYYSGGHNLVPHTPDVCWLGGGYQPAQPHENVEIDLDSPESEALRVPVRVCTFGKTTLQNRVKQSVIYTFYCNGEFVCTRTGVRLLMNQLTTTYAFFSKVEVSFLTATRAEGVEGAKKLFGRILPLLIRNHWPDFEGAEEDARKGASSES